MTLSITTLHLCADYQYAECYVSEQYFKGQNIFEFNLNFN